MSLDIHFSEDIRNALLAANEASAATAAVAAEGGGDPVTLRAYRQGYTAALATLALAFGLAPQIIHGREVVDGERATELLASGKNLAEAAGRGATGADRTGRGHR